MRYLLEIENLKVQYLTKQGAVHALDGVNLYLKPGEILGVAGETGSGKTTLALSILRLLPRNARIIDGKIIFDNINLLSLPIERMQTIRQERISLILQGTSKGLHPVIPSGWQVGEAIEYHEGLPPEEILESIRNIFREVELGTRAIISLPDELSVGMRQKVKIALAISTKPDLIIADEPFVGLDPPMQLLMVFLLKKLYEKYGFSMLIMSHNLGRMAEICDHMAIIYAGETLEYNTTYNVFNQPIHPYTKGLIGAIPRLKHIKRRLISMPGSPPSALNPPKGCKFWPRCPYAKDLCKEKRPPLVYVNGGLVACHFADELKDLSPWDFWGQETI